MGEAIYWIVSLKITDVQVDVADTRKEEEDTPWEIDLGLVFNFLNKTYLIT